MSDDLAVGLVLVLLATWLFVRVWWGGLAVQVAKAVQS
jgi:hypothetical protein